MKRFYLLAFLILFISTPADAQNLAEKEGPSYVITGRYSGMIGIGGEDDLEISGGNGIDVSGGLALKTWLIPVVYASYTPIESVGILSGPDKGASIGLFGGVKLRSPILLSASLMGGTEIRTAAPSSKALALQLEGGLDIPWGNDEKLRSTASLGYRASNKAVSLLIAVGFVFRLD